MWLVDKSVAPKLKEREIISTYELFWNNQEAKTKEVNAKDFYGLAYQISCSILLLYPFINMLL